LSIISAVRALLGGGRRSQDTSSTTLTERDFERAAHDRGQRLAFLDWVGIWTVDEAGVAYFAEFTDLSDQIVITDARERNVALFQAARRHPDLVHLKPVRHDGDYDCPACKGSGRFEHVTAENIWCTCGGVGWLPASYVDPHRDRVT
jgi:hypothetical protein